MNGNLTGKNIVVTGATSGIGFAAAARLAGLGAYVIGVGRSQERCREAENKIRQAYPGAGVTFLVADLSSLSQVRELAQNIRQALEAAGSPRLDALVNNAGAVSGWYVATGDGFELQFAVNHLAPFLLTHELLPLLKAAGQGRVINISSGSHYRTRLNWKDIMLRKRYGCLKAYKQTKLCNVLFTAEFNRRAGLNQGVRAYAVDPGLVNTDIGLKGTGSLIGWFWKKRSRRGAAPEKAAETIIHLACMAADPLPGEIYWKDCRPKKPSRYSLQEDHAKRLWDTSEKMCGMRAER